MRNLRFFIRYALSNMRRNGQRTFVVLFCIAAGVAAVVSSRTLGLTIEDSLARNLQAQNKGDLVIKAPGSIIGTAKDETLIEKGAVFQTDSFSDKGIALFQGWAGENGFDIMPASRGRGISRMHLAENAAGSALALIYFVDRARYPFYGSIDILSPPGLTLAEALQDESSIVISKRLAREADAAVGARLRVAGAPEAFVVTGIMGDAAEASLDNVQAVLFPAAYVSYSTGVERFDIKADTFYVRLPPGTDVAAVEASFLAQFPGLDTTTTEKLREENDELAETTKQLITTMGLVSLLIGGIGIVNTMIVVVGRRILEIAVLKTVGVPGHQITLMFIVESLLLGLLGSVAGVILGPGLVFALRGAAEGFVGQALPFTLYPEAMGMGLVVGVVVTLVFGFLPTLSAGRVRPNLVLHPTDAVLPRVGCGLSLLVAIGMTAIIGLIAGHILKSYLLGIAVAYGAMLILALSIAVLRGIVWLLGRLPSFGNVYIKLAQRAIASHKGRTASTLLGLVVGLFSLSLILLLTTSLTNVVADLAEVELGGNVLAASPSVPQSEELERAIATRTAITSVAHDVIYQAQVVAINGDRELDAVLANAGWWMAHELHRFINRLHVTVLSADTLDYGIAAGEDITPDSERRVVLHSKQVGEAAGWLGLEPGDTLTLQFGGGEERTVTIAGLTADPGATAGLRHLRLQSGVVSQDAVPSSVEPTFSLFPLTVEHDKIDETVVALSDIPDVFVIDVSQLNADLEALFDQLAALPLMVAGLALFSSGVIIANTVSLATLERRRQIGIMKAIGLGARRVLGLLLLESGLVGLVGGILGTGICVIGILATGLLGDSVRSFPFSTLFALILLAVGIALAATLLTAYGTSREKPLVVLRYE